eukprot:2633359-Pyramimonas_sp.AAC.1
MHVSLSMRHTLRNSSRFNPALPCPSPNESQRGLLACGHTNYPTLDQLTLEPASRNIQVCRAIAAVCNTLLLADGISHAQLVL